MLLKPRKCYRKKKSQQSTFLRGTVGKHCTVCHPSTLLRGQSMSGPTERQTAIDSHTAKPAIKSHQLSDQGHVVGLWEDTGAPGDRHGENMRAPLREAAGWCVEPWSFSL